MYENIFIFLGMVPFSQKKTSLKIFHWDKTLQTIIQTTALSEQNEDALYKGEA